MKFSAWIDYPSMSIAITKSDLGFTCQKYVESSLIRNTKKDFRSLDQLQAFLLSLPNPPKDQIQEAIINLL